MKPSELPLLKEILDTCPETKEPQGILNVTTGGTQHIDGGVVIETRGATTAWRHVLTTEEIHRVPEPPAPAPPTVPLGENVTRSGLRARVVCNDGPGERPVVALVQKMQGSRLEQLRTYPSDGGFPGVPSLDLVGHRYHEIKTPEPVRPREFWLNYYANRTLAELCAHGDKDEADLKAGKMRTECIHVREVLPGEDTELEDLRRWKAEAIASMPDYPAIGEEMGLTIGDDVPSSILPYICDLKAKLEAAKKALQ